MRRAQVKLIRRSFDAIWPVRSKIASLFYERLFELTPDVRPLFSADMENQHQKLMDMIGAMVATLDEGHRFDSIVSQMGRQHKHLGIRTSHFAAFQNAFTWCLEQQFGSAFSPETRAAWITLYDSVRDEMLEAAKPGAVA